MSAIMIRSDSEMVGLQAAAQTKGPSPFVVSRVKKEKGAMVVAFVPKNGSKIGGRDTGRGRQKDTLQ